MTEEVRQADTVSGSGSGDYTAEREALLADVTMEELLEDVRELAQQKT